MTGERQFYANFNTSTNMLELRADRPQGTLVLSSQMEPRVAAIVDASKFLISAGYVQLYGWTHSRIGTMVATYIRERPTEADILATIATLKAAQEGTKVNKTGRTLIANSIATMEWVLGEGEHPFEHLLEG